ncbi:MAG: 6-hydroxycyclohex-1-ene-1-carbonyl-CoA dehydrogenase [Parvularculaceae bacterium]
MKPVNAFGYFLTAANAPLERRDFVVDQLRDDQVLIEVAGCGLCHTDLGFIAGEVRIKRDLPLILGHEISGTVIAAGAGYQNLIGTKVIVPAVLPCGECELCKSGRDNICQRQEMPGNDFNGGFASHVVTPGRSLCPLPDDLNGFEPAQLSVIADAITTPYQALLRSGLEAGDLAIVIGVGGVGLYMVQHARNAGAKVIALDIDDAKLAAAGRQGAEFTINSKGMNERDVKSTIRALAKDHKLPRFKWKVFETSGSAGGQAAAYALLSFAGSVSVVGFTMEKINIRLSNIMAFDAALIGNWGCSPTHYPAVVDNVLSRKINLLDNIETHSLDEINDIVALALDHKLERRAILVPAR